MGFFKGLTSPKAKFWLETETPASLGEELKGFVGVISSEDFNIALLTVNLRSWEYVKKRERIPFPPDWVYTWEKRYGHSDFKWVAKHFHIKSGTNQKFPFSFKIPADCKGSDYYSNYSTVEWVLSATMTVAGRKDKSVWNPIFVSSRILFKKATDDEFNLDCEINLDTMTALLNWKFPDREKGGGHYISELLKELKRAGIKTFRKLNKIIDENMDWVLSYEKRALIGKPYNYADVGIVRVILRERLKK